MPRSGCGGWTGQAPPTRGSLTTTTTALLVLTQLGHALGSQAMLLLLLLPLLNLVLVMWLRMLPWAQRCLAYSCSSSSCRGFRWQGRSR